METPRNDCTALHWAADQGHAEACELLLKFGAQVDDEDDDARGLRQVWSDVKRNLQRKSQAWTPLCLAAEERYEEFLFNLHLAFIFTYFHHSYSCC